MSAWLRESALGAEKIEATLNPQIKIVLESPLFKDRLPKEWDILLDGEWKDSSAYWSRDLRSPEGKPAILITPEALIADRSPALLIHELTHLVHDGLRPQEDSWVAEGLAMLAEYLITQKLNPIFPQAFAEPETSLVYDFGSQKKDDFGLDRAAAYGHVLLYFYYLHRVCGSSFFLKALTSKSPKKGIELINEVLKDLDAENLRQNRTTQNTCMNFRNSFRAFEIAKFMADPTQEDSYVLITSLKTKLRDEPQKLPPYSAAAYRLREGQKCGDNEIEWGSSRCIQIRE